MKVRACLAAIGLLGSFALPAAAQPVMMSADWAKGACEAWNKNAVLTDKLAESGWAKNDASRGFKVMQVYRSDCGEAASAELRIALKGGKALCVYGGRIESEQLNYGSDYLMSAETQRWVEMGRGDYGPMRAMMFGRLQFKGPTIEAMGNMGPFENFLLLVGKVPSAIKSCPAG